MAKILVVEDEPDIRMLTSFSLRYGGFEVIEAENGQQAVAMAAAELPDLILLDVRMPIMDGLTACREIKAMPATMHIPIVFLSALGQESEVDSGSNAGAVAYILKPYVPEELIGKVRSLINEYSQLNRQQPLPSSCEGERGWG